MSKVPVTTRALILRINRRLKPELRRMRSCRRNSRWWGDLCDYYVIDADLNAIVDSHVDAEAYGRELGVVRAFEMVVDDALTADNGR